MHVYTIDSLKNHFQAIAILRHCPQTSLHSNCHISYLTLQIEVFLSIPKSSLHKLCIGHGFTLMTSSLYGWEAFPLPWALNHIRIVWAFSQTVPKISGVPLTSLLCP